MKHDKTNKKETQKIYDKIEEGLKPEIPEPEPTIPGIPPSGIPFPLTFEEFDDILSDLPVIKFIVRF